MRVPAQFTVRGSRLSPPSVSVPPFLAVELSIASGDGRPHRGTLATQPPRALAVPAGGRLVVKLRGLKRGSYALRLSGGAHGTLVIGAEPGP